MNDLKIDISDLVAQAQRKLLEAKPHVVEYRDAQKMEEGIFPAALKGVPMNLYALWARSAPDEAWKLKYIGEQNVYAGQARLRQHLFWKPTSTQTKQEYVRSILAAGGQIGITAILVEPDTMRLAIEEELIIRNIKTETCLPWNLHGRQLAKLWQKAETSRIASLSREVPEAGN